MQSLYFLFFFDFCNFCTEDLQYEREKQYYRIYLDIRFFTPFFGIKTAHPRIKLETCKDVKKFYLPDKPAFVSTSSLGALFTPRMPAAESKQGGCAWR